jgi:TIR domain
MVRMANGAAGELGIKPYLAEHDVRPGENLADKIKPAIDASAAVVVLISDNSVAAQYVNQEIGYALKADKLIIPPCPAGDTGRAARDASAP